LVWKKHPQKIVVSCVRKFGRIRNQPMVSSVPTQNCARDFRLALYVRETVYSLPPITRST